MKEIPSGFGRYNRLRPTKLEEEKKIEIECLKHLLLIWLFFAT